MLPRTFDLRVDPINASNYAAIYANPDTRWYAQRSTQRLARALTAAGEWNPLEHPRGKDGKFLEKFGWVRWLDKDMKWKDGWISDIDPDTGELTVRSGGSTSKFPNAKNLYSRPKRKARLGLPNPIDGSTPDGWKKVGGQGGSNPGGMYQIDGPSANDSPDLGPKAKVTESLMQMSAGNPLYGIFLKDPGLPSHALIPGDQNVVSVPRLDGTKGRQDVLYRSGDGWYRVPASGSMLDSDGVLRDDLKWSPDDVFGEPGSDRRKAVLADLDAHSTTLGGGFEPDDLAGLIQQTGANLPKGGDKFYVKTMNIPERARNEAMANHLYELLGVPVPDVAVGNDGKTISSKIIPGNVAFDPSNPAHIKAAQQGFVADALLANWDAVGQSYDNMQVDADGNVWRIDAGGSLAYRAQGKPKGAMFGTTVGEMTSLRDPKINPQAALVYGGISYAEMTEQANVLATIQPNELLDLADEFGMPELGPILVARRQNILDSLGVSTFVPPEPDEYQSVINKLKQPDLNPAQHVDQMGTGPHVAVDNYANVFGNLKTETYGDIDFGADSEAVRAEYFKNSVVARGGDLYTYSSEYQYDPISGIVTMMGRNLFTGKVEKLYLKDDTPLLADYQRTDPALDNLVDELSVYRELAIADIVAQAKGVPLGGFMGDPGFFVPDDSVDSNTVALHHNQLGLVNWNHLLLASERGALGPDNSWPLRDEHGDLWEIKSFPADEDGDLVLQYAGPSSTGKASWTLNKNNFKGSSVWWRPANDTTAALWKSKENPDLLEPDAPAENIDLPQGENIKADLTPDINVGGDIPEPVSGDDDDSVGGVFIKEEPATWHFATDDEFNEAFGDQAPAAKNLAFPGGIAEYNAQQQEFSPELEKLLADEEEIAQSLADAAPTIEVKTNGTIVDVLGPGEQILSTEWSIGDLEQIKTDLMGKNVVVLPIGALDDPDWNGQVGIANGLATVVDVKSTETWVYAHTNAEGVYINGQYADIVAVQVKLPTGQTATIQGGDLAKNPKVLFTVDTEPIPTKPVFKQSGQILVNGVVVGTWNPPHSGDYSDPGYYYYSGVIDADHSITGKPLKFQTNKKKNLGAGPASLVVPIAPKPVKAKSTKVYKTEQEIKDLNALLVDVQAQISTLQETLSNPGMPGDGVPLADGSHPQIGDWVMSTKDGKYGKVVELNPNIGPAYSAAVAANYIKLNFQDPVTGKWKKSNRTMPTLVKVAGPGETPFVMETKALHDPGGSLYGPGSVVYAAGAVSDATDAGDFSNQLVLDTTIDGKVKLKHADGTVHWTTKNKVFAAGKAAEEEGAVLPTIKKLPSNASAEQINADLAVLTKTSESIALQIANSTSTPPKKKKPVGTPYPGPNGMTVKQPSSYAEDRTNKGLNNLKDGYAPLVGQILRHNDGTAYVVAEVGDTYSSHKNSVRVYPLDQPYAPSKWRAVTTMVVDHETMLTDSFGAPLPIINDVEGADWHPVSGLLWRQDTEQSYYHLNPLTGKSEYRTKNVSKFFVVSSGGEVYDLTGKKLYPWEAQNALMNSQRVGYIDKSHTGPDAMKLTVSIQPHDKVGTIQYAVIHQPNESAGVVLAEATAAVQPGSDKLVSTPAPKPVPTPEPESFQQPSVPENVEPTPTAPDLPVFAGKDPLGTELPHPAVTSSSAGVPVYQSAGGTNLDVAGVAGARSVMSAVAETIDTAKANKQTGDHKWISTYGLADHDVIEDMMVQTQVVRDASGAEFIEVRFRMEAEAARANHTTFITSSVNQAGDWEFTNRNAKNLVAGDMIAVRVSGGGGATVSGALRPDGGAGEGKTPNATVTGPPVLIGKNKAGQFDVWRTPVVTANGDAGWIDLEDRDGADTIATAYWDATKPRTTNGNKSLNVNAQNDGWSVAATRLGYTQADSGQVDQRYPDAVKQLGSGKNALTVGNGWTLQRDHDGAHIEYQTSATKNSNDGKVVIRVPVNDPEAQRKISQAMELVGVSKEDQAPPDKAALTKMATNKVWEQFNATYTKGKKPNSPEEALTAIDKAVGAQLGRPATMDDISLRISPDGRVQVLVSEDVSRAIVAKNGVKSYQHRFSTAGKQASIEGAMTGETPGLMATTERWQHGLFYDGMSSIPDHSHDSADHLFLRMSTDNSTTSELLILDPVTIHRHVDYYWQPGDSYGDRQSNQLNWLNPGSAANNGGNELMIQRRLEPELWAHIIMKEPNRTETIKHLHNKGVTHAPNGMLLENFFVTTGGNGALSKAPPSFGAEIPLSSLPDTVPTAPPLVVV